MKRPGQIVLTPFPHTDLSGPKLRPVLMLRKVPTRFDDWLVCMVSSQIQQAEANFDEVIAPADDDYAAAGLKLPSVIRLSRLAVLDGARLVGAARDERLERLCRRLADWIAGK